MSRISVINERENKEKKISNSFEVGVNGVQSG